MRRSIVGFVLLILTACSGTSHAPNAAPGVTLGVVDGSANGCAVSYDGFVWYRVPKGAFPPVDVRHARCDPASLWRDPDPARPAWAIPNGPTQARFVFTSLQQHVAREGMQSLERSAARYHVPVSWMIGNLGWLDFAGDYNAYHAANGDDAQSAFFASLHAAIAQHLPWYRPKVSVLSAGTERLIPQGLAPGERAFWGIAWNSQGTDGTFDYGAPWGAYCADVHSYKRPQPDGGCDLLAFEWTARDLTRAYLSGHEDAFSTDPDDLRERGGFSTAQAQRYARALVDAYAAAGQVQPLVMLVQQESVEEPAPGDREIVEAMLGQAVRDGMHVETLGAAADDARTFAAAPRAIAFPYLAGGRRVPAPLLGGGTLYPATIDYHDDRIGATFLAGHTLPSRTFRYADATVSRFDRPLHELAERDRPVLKGARIGNGTLELTLHAPVALHYAAALWSDPSALGLSGGTFVPAGRAGAVLVFDLTRGTNRVRYRCTGCRGSALPYSQ